MKTLSYSHISLGPFWCVGSAFFLALGWLLPNNLGPLNAFHSNAWVALVLALVSLVVLWKSPKVVAGQVFTLVTIAACLIPIAQYIVGVLPFAGQVLVAIAYLLGFALAIVTGQQWQRLCPLWMERVLFGAFLFAGTVSVYIALYQWFRLSGSEGITAIWVLDFPIDMVRPYANMAQPNQLATLLLWSLVGCVWLVYRGYVQMVGGLSIAALLLLGLALTQSRSGVVGIVFILFACWKWRHLISSRVFSRCAVGLALWYALLPVVLHYLGRALLLDTDINYFSRSANESRPYMWRMLLEAAMQRPWTGYGWNQVMNAQLEVSEAYPRMAGTYLAQSHNLFLDFVVWNGFPLGLLLSGLVLTWFWVVLRKVNDASQIFYLTLIAVTGIHAMVELPLQYAYFLLPVGLAIGSLNSSLNICMWGRMSRRLVLGLWFVNAAFLTAILHDYFGLEGAYNDVRFKQGNFVNAPEPQIPKALVLDQLQYAIELYDLAPAAGMTAEAIQRAVDSTTFMPSAYNISKLAVVLALNQRPEEARYWMGKAKFMMNSENYESVKKDWSRAARQFPQIAEILEIQQ
ncbi:MAG: Wzy polymerase domain-containing protein [Pseudomonadota bacterium]